MKLERFLLSVFCFVPAVTLADRCSQQRCVHFWSAVERNFTFICRNLISEPREKLIKTCSCYSLAIYQYFTIMFVTLNVIVRVMHVRPAAFPHVFMLCAVSFPSVCLFCWIQLVRGGNLSMCATNSSCSFDTLKPSSGESKPSFQMCVVLALLFHHGMIFVGCTAALGTYSSHR